MTSCYQNAWLLIHTMSTPIITFRERPCMPADAQHSDWTSVTLHCLNGIVLTWYKDGSVEETLPNGDKTIFPARPTLAAFLDGSYVLAEFFLEERMLNRQLHGNYFEFRGDGATLYRRNGSSFLWSPEFPAKGCDGVLSYCFNDYDDDSWITERRDSFS